MRHVFRWRKSVKDVSPPLGVLARPVNIGFHWGAIVEASGSAIHETGCSHGDWEASVKSQTRSKTTTNMGGSSLNLGPRVRAAGVGRDSREDEE